jgi:hypothetical protein
MEIQLNFTNPLYVSSSNQGKDLINITCLVPFIFQSKSYGTFLKGNYSIEGEIPKQMISKKEYDLKYS